MDRFFFRDLLIFMTYSLAVYWGICIERSVQGIHNQDRSCQCPPVLEGPVEQVPMPTNVAAGAHTSQSSMGWGSDPGHAVDGNLDGSGARAFCMYTQNGDTEWWQVDLGSEHYVAHVDLYYRTGGREAVKIRKALTGAKVFVSDTADYASGTKCGEHTGDAVDVVECANVPVGRFVTVEHHNEFLYICEAEVFGTPLSPLSPLSVNTANEL